MFHQIFPPPSIPCFSSSSGSSSPVGRRIRTALYSSLPAGVAVPAGRRTTHLASGIRRFARDRHPKLDGGRGSSCQRGRCRERERLAPMLTRSVPAAGLGTARGFSGLTRRLARQEARNAECGPSSLAAARLWMPDSEKLGRARPGSTVEDSRRLRLGSWGTLVVGRGGRC